MPRVIIYGLLILTAVSFIPMAFLAKARVTDSVLPRLQIVPDMDHQPEFRAQAANPFFADGRAMRPPVPGSVARGELHSDPVFFTGKEQGEWITTNPLPITTATMNRGQERFGIYCATCHGFTGNGDSMVSRRADKLQEGTWTPPTDLTSQVVADRPDGHIFNTITHGIRNMPVYGPQVTPEDRWAIVAYVRALQRSRGASLQDVPESIQPTLK